MSKFQEGKHSVKAQESLPVRVGCGRETLDRPMTVRQARLWGNQNMPRDLKRAGFEVVVFRSDPDINDGNFLRVSYGKAPGPDGKWS